MRSSSAATCLPAKASCGQKERATLGACVTGEGRGAGDDHQAGLLYAVRGAATPGPSTRRGVVRSVPPGRAGSPPGSATGLLLPRPDRRRAGRLRLRHRVPPGAGDHRLVPTNPGQPGRARPSPHLSDRARRGPAAGRGPGRPGDYRPAHTAGPARLRRPRSYRGRCEG
jgi:hypothetical protein